VVSTLPLAVVLSAVFAGSGVLALVGTPDRSRPLARLAQPAMSASMLALTWTRLGALALSWQAILFTAVAGSFALGHRPDGLARALPAAASVWMLVAPPGWFPTGALGAALLVTVVFWARRPLRGRPAGPCSCPDWRCTG